MDSNTLITKNSKKLTRIVLAEVARGENLCNRVGETVEYDCPNNEIKDKLPVNGVISDRSPASKFLYLLR